MDQEAISEIPMPGFKKLENCGDQCGMENKVPFPNVLECKISQKKMLEDIPPPKFHAP